MTELVTRCPDCHVAFRASRAQLRAAGGRVRCGACFSVFNGRDNLVTPPAPLAPGDAPTAPGEKPGPAPPGTPDSGAPEPSGSTYKPAPELILEPAPGPETDTPTAEDSEEHRNELDPPVTFEPSPQVSLPLEAPEPARELPPIPEPPGTAISELELSASPRQPSPPGRKNWPWAVLLVLASLTLALQFLHFYAGSLPPTANHRAAWATFCRFTGCRLPALEDRSRIEVRNLMVRSHPDYRGALLMDTTLINNAGFRQPFPPLILEFSDLQGTPVARRRLLPRDYLAGEARDMATMPIGRPVHLELELLDPGAEAVSYRLEIPDK